MDFKMLPSTPEVDALFAIHIVLLDRAEISNESIFKNEKDKEKYETFLMYSLRKYKAAAYHSKNIVAFIKKDESNLRGIKTIKMPKESLENGSIKVKTNIQFLFPADHYVYELSAFLAALKSSLDLLAKICAFHMPGVTADSISTLIRMVEKNDGPIIEVVKKHLDWLEGLRTYRHHLLHRLVITPTGGYKVQQDNLRIKRMRLPIVVPIQTPRHVPDTRRTKAMQFPPRGIKVSELKAANSASSGKKRIKWVAEILPSDGYLEIENFTKMHLDMYTSFYTQLIKALKSLFSQC